MNINSYPGNTIEPTRITGTGLLHAGSKGAKPKAMPPASQRRRPELCDMAECDSKVWGSITWHS
jgi:hypothetical protein